MRTFSVGIIMVVCVAFGIASVGCSKKDSAREAGARRSAHSTDGDASPHWKNADKKAADEKKGDLGTRDSSKMTAAVADAASGVERPKQSREKDPGLPSGILTAGSFDDNLDPRVFLSFIDMRGQDRYLGDAPGKVRGQRLMVIVKDQSGKPVSNARVKLASKDASAELMTRSDGRAIFVLPWDRLPADKALTATVLPPCGGMPATDTIPPGKERWEIALPGVQTPLPRGLDLAIMLDTTGSMGDELRHLQAEIRGIATAVRKKFPEVNQRYALVLYRDEGDDYVVRRFDFTSSLEEFHGRLAKQSAGGGGDYPEAVHRAFEEAQQLRWQESDTARVLFWVADAPPHSQHVARAMAAADNLRKNGVVIYPIACSGYDDSTEFLMRSCALLTGGQFLFLTDDSGVGNSHAEPKIPYYQVERLERLIVRMIAGELSGRRIDADPADIIRTVGKKVN
ncbi:MAG: VWA domain-containing protein [Planctomycetes bacterium]|nr:VWA domain-containing protein [Planctomycetota bacterium]